MPGSWASVCESSQEIRKGVHSEGTRWLVSLQGEHFQLGFSLPRYVVENKQTLLQGTSGAQGRFQTRLQWLKLKWKVLLVDWDFVNMSSLQF